MVISPKDPLRAFPLLLLAALCLALRADAGVQEGAEALTGRIVDRVDIQGARHTREHVIRRELRTDAGTAFDAQTLADDLQRLDNLDIFSSLRADVQPEGPDRVVVTLVVRELPPFVPYISYDVNDQDGWSFGPAVKAVNLFGQDIFLAGYALFGGRDTFLIDLTHPWFGPHHLSFDLDLARYERDNTLDDFGEEALEVTPRVGWWIGTRGRASVVASYMRFSADRQAVLLSDDGDDVLIRLGGSLGYDSRDVWANPRHGWKNELEVIKTGGILPGDGDFWTVNADVRRFQPLGPNTLVLAGLLSLQPGTVDEDLPVYMDYHLGGANSLRGYTVDDLGRRLFGAHQLLTTMEYRFPLIEPTEITLFGLSGDLGLGGTLLLDGGLAWTARDEFDLDRARFGVGTGLRVLIPAVDMTRVEVGYGADGWRFWIASFSKMRAQRLRLR